ncbi:MAG: MarR family transcriptional regulator [DPANN group archaeon]|nr:MarR family transcriptional regulator [DPANN group archaeon]
MVENISSFELYGADRTIVLFDNNVKTKIMHFISKSERTFDEIVIFVKRSKSTVSDILTSMEQSGLIISKRDPLDKRKKTYQSCAVSIGISSKPTPELYHTAIKGVGKSIDTSFTFMNSIFKSMRYVYSSFGVDVSSALKLMGLNVGIEISRQLKSSSLESLLLEIVDFWDKHQLGYMKVISQNPLTLIIEDCYECSGMDNVGKTLCVFDEGMLISIFDNRLGLSSTVKEVECFGTGFEHCKFIVLFDKNI